MSALEVDELVASSSVDEDNPANTWNISYPGPAIGPYAALVSERDKLSAAHRKWLAEMQPRFDAMRRERERRELETRQRKALNKAARAKQELREIEAHLAEVAHRKRQEALAARKRYLVFAREERARLRKRSSEP